MVKRNTVNPLLLVVILMLLLNLASKAIADPPPPPEPDITAVDSQSPADDKDIPFGTVTVGTYSDQTVTVKNDGNAPLEIGTIDPSNQLAAPFGILNNNCSGTMVNPSASCTVTVRFSPIATGSPIDSFDIPSNDPDEASVTINVSGTGVSISVADITVIDSLDSATDLQMPFGSIAIGLSVVKITNDGNANLVIGTIDPSNQLAAPFGIGNDNCSNHTLAPAASCTFTVSFSPTATGSFSGSFDIPSNDPDEASVTIAVSGTGYFPSGNNNNPNPPSVFTLTFPSNGQTGLGTTITLKWEKSTDPDRNAVTYKLYYSDNPHFIGSTPIQIASLSGASKNTYYAGAGMSMSLLLFGIVLGGGVRGRRKTTYLIVLLVIAVMLFVSCGGGGGGGGTSSSSGGGSSSNEVSQSVSSLNSGTTYYWKVSADDGNGGITESETRSFTTTQ